MSHFWANYHPTINLTASIFHPLWQLECLWQLHFKWHIHFQFILWICLEKKISVGKCHILLRIMQYYAKVNDRDLYVTPPSSWLVWQCSLENTMHGRSKLTENNIQKNINPYSNTNQMLQTSVVCSLLKGRVNEHCHSLWVGVCLTKHSDFPIWCWGIQIVSFY